MNEPLYQPGVCNIGNKEVKKRKILAALGVFDYFFFAALFTALRVPSVLFLLLFIPALLTFLGIFQSRQKFCVAYGLKGQSSFHDKVEKVDVAVHAQDKQKSVSMIWQSVLCAIGFTAIAYFAYPLLLQVIPAIYGSTY